SGVMSRGASPVPPVVSTTSAASWSHQSSSRAMIAPLSSATTARSTAWHPCSAAQSAIALPDASARSPREQASEMVRMARRRDTAMKCGVWNSATSDQQPATVVKLPVRALVIERHLHYGGRNAFAANLDRKTRIGPGQRGGEVAGADRDAE